MLKKLPLLRFSDNYIKAAAFTKPADTRTTQQLLNNIDCYAEKFPEVAKLKNELKSMNPKHLGLVSDICELTRLDNYNGINIDISKNIDIRRLVANGKSLFATLLELLPKASKENPESLHFAQEVINQTDTIVSKYFLAACPGYFTHTEAARHLEATRPLIKDIAQVTLSGGYTMDYSKEQRFVNALNTYINPAVNPEKIKVVAEAMKTVEKLPESINLTCAIDSSTILNSKVSPQRMRENLETFSQIAEGLSQKTHDVNLSEFITRNVNLTE